MILNISAAIYCYGVLLQAGEIEKGIKGVEVGDPWLVVENTRL